MHIGTHTIGYGQPTFVIAELCSNITRYIRGNAGTELELKILVDIASESGADALKVQLYRADHFPESEHDSKRQTEFPRRLFGDFVQLAHQSGLMAGASVFDEEAVQLCVDSGADFLKLATREFPNQSLLFRCLNTQLPLFRSYDSSLYPTGLDNGFANDLIHLACHPMYPVINPKIPDLHMVDEYDRGCDWGYSSHSPDWLDVCLAVSRGACAIEKHIAFHDDDPERGWSLLPREFAKMVEDIHRVEEMR